ncbi:unnamed protein product [Prorocentrum cordatum]|uniref:Uncharacterized protein n=1 Tax=Prorocentrum cordatum TaxID=2364126 RepID=A0ABN9UEC8_9DINO|nr:unnamed protein product [Polarella glacialis]
MQKTALTAWRGRPMAPVAKTSTVPAAASGAAFGLCPRTDTPLPVPAAAERVAPTEQVAEPQAPTVSSERSRRMQDGKEQENAVPHLGGLGEGARSGRSPSQRRRHGLACLPRSATPPRSSLCGGRTPARSGARG